MLAFLTDRPQLKAVSTVLDKLAGARTIRELKAAVAFVEEGNFEGEAVSASKFWDVVVRESALRLFFVSSVTD